MDPISTIWIFTFVAASYLSYKRLLAPQQRKNEASRFPEDREHPLVCIQIPVFNEPENTIDCLQACLKIRWPKDRLSIQVLDDSTDETTELIADFLRKYEDGTAVYHLHRKQREGFKAGALAEGMAVSDAEFFAVFDCDFRPHADFLTKAMASFVDAPGVAAVQACWTYYNRNTNPLTKLQSILLNLHFKIEHAGRFSRGLLFNFNGTGGVWRKAAIIDAGGWSASSVAEDLLLSYKAQLRGWQLVYREDVEVPSALPDTMSAFVIQQRRWAKGNGQVLRLLGSTILRATDLRIRARLDALFHLVGYGFATTILTAYLLSPLWIVEKAQWNATTDFYDPIRIFDTVLWTGLMFAFFSLFLYAPLYRRDDSKPARVFQTLSLLALSPLLVAYTFTHYWGGFFNFGPKRKQLFFHRTPKEQAGSVVQKQLTNWLLMGSFALFCGGLSWQHELYFSAFGFFLQAALLWYILGYTPPLSPDRTPLMAEESSRVY